jgi:UDP-N-acetylglucosamine:LPS N-acetylglucosamine transferase
VVQASTTGGGRAAFAARARPRERPRPRLLAVSSGGGHWVELRRLRGAFAGVEVAYASTDPSAEAEPGARRHVIRNVTRRDRWGFVALAWQLGRLLARERPDVVLTTGAAPGLVAIVLAKLVFGCRTIWIDSIAASHRLSLSARLARPFADAWLVQWPHLARAEGPEFWGAVV